MRALRLHGAYDLRLHDESQPTPRQGEQLLRVTAVGICGSDLRWFSAGGIGDATLSQPLVLGHEFAAVTPSGVRVAVDPAISCRKCEACMRGHPNLCAEVRFAGHGSVDGALREYLAWDERCLFPLPDSMTDEDGAMLEPLGVAMHAVRLASLETGMTAAVFGCGPIGLLTIQVARGSGATVLLATDRLAARVAAAREFGAGQAHLVEGRLDPGAIRAATGGRGVDAAFEVAGDQGAVDDAFATVAIGGKVILAGIPDDDRTSFPASVARRKGLTVKLVRRMKGTYPRAIELVSQRRVDVRSLVTHRFPLSQAGDAFLAAERREGLKVIVTVGAGR